MKLSKNDKKNPKTPDLQIVIDGDQIDDAFWNILDKETQTDIRRLIRIREEMKKKQKKKKAKKLGLVQKTKKKGMINGVINGYLIYKNQQYNYTTIFCKT